MANVVNELLRDRWTLEALELLGALKDIADVSYVVVKQQEIPQ